MQIQVNTDNTIEGRERLIEQVEAIVSEGLSRFSDRLSRVEIHLSDVNGNRGGNDKHCVLEARPNGMGPLVTTDQADTVDKVVRATTRKMVSSLDTTFGKLGVSH